MTDHNKSSNTPFAVQVNWKQQYGGSDTYWYKTIGEAKSSAKKWSSHPKVKDIKKIKF